MHVFILPDGLTYEATDCFVSITTNTLITCTSSPGVGKGHAWNLTVDATAAAFEGGRAADRVWSVVSSSSSVTTSYASPTLTSVTGAFGMSTSGGRTVTLNGTNFPPYACLPAGAASCGGSASLAWALSDPSLEVDIQWVDPNWSSITGASTAGSFLDSYCVSLKMVVGGLSAECVVGPGVGNQLFWGVTVGGGEVVPSVALSTGLAQFTDTGYASPTILALAGSSSSGGSSSSSSVFGLTTAGGESVFLSGENLGEEFGSLAASIGVDGLSAPALIVTYGPAGSMGDNADPFDGGATKYSAAECVVVVDHVQVQCTTVAGVGANLTWRVGIAGQWGNSQCVDVDDNGGGGSSSSNAHANVSSSNSCGSNVTTSYAPPIVRPEVDSQSSSSLTPGASNNAVTGAGVDGGSTPGGQQLLVAGLQFGPESEPDAPVVTYGPSPAEVDKYTAKSCQVGSLYIECLIIFCLFFIVYFLILSLCYEMDSMNNLKSLKIAVDKIERRRPPPQSLTCILLKLCFVFGFVRSSFFTGLG
jgi:hypothetical protein